MMLKSNLHPPREGLNADPVLFGVAAGLAALFPPIDRPEPQAAPVGEGKVRQDAPADPAGET